MGSRTNRRGLTATNLAIHQHFRCDLYLHYTYHGVEDQHARKELVGQPSEITKAHFERGTSWEAKLYKWLDENNLLLTIIGAGTCTGRDVQDILDIDERDHFFVTGLTIEPPNKAMKLTYQERSPQHSPVSFSLAKPDLLEIRRIGQQVEWRVIDAKASSLMKTSHQVQLYFYYQCLLHLLPRPRYKPMADLAIWLPTSANSEPSFHGIRTVSKSTLVDTLRPYLFEELPRTLNLPQEQVPWHFNPLCRGCPFERICIERAVGEGTLGSMPNISLDDAQVLRQLLSTAHADQHKSDIENLHEILGNPAQFSELERKVPSLSRKTKIILGIPPRRKTIGPLLSPMVEAAITGEIQTIQRRNYTCPQSEDIAVMISVVHDPVSHGIAGFAISVFTTIASLQMKPLVGASFNLVATLAGVIRSILELEPRATGSHFTTQFYMFSQTEVSLLQRHLIDIALSSSGEPDFNDDLHLCIGAVCEGASLLATEFTPSILSGAFLDFLHRKGVRTERELIICAERLGLDSSGTTDELLARIKDEIRRVQEAGGRVPHGTSASASQQVGQLPLVVSLKRELERMLALPIPGHWDLPDSASIIFNEESRTLSDDNLYELFKDGRLGELSKSLVLRNKCIFAVLEALRDQAGYLMVNKACRLSVEFMDLCHQPQLKKLFFMQQFEVLTRLSELWQSRIDGCPNSPVLLYEHTNAEHIHTFILESGSVDTPQERTFFNFLLTEDKEPLGTGDEFAGVPLEALFDDVSLCGAYFPLNKVTRSQWDQQHPDVLQGLRVADLIDVEVQGTKTVIKVCTWGSYRALLKRGKKYRLSPRLVDFNLSKVLSALLELDLRTATDGVDNVPFLHIIENPHLFTNRMDEEWNEYVGYALKEEEIIQNTVSEAFHDQGVQEARQLLLKPSQRNATRRILSHHLSVIWGPPGTGKTHTIAATILRLLQIQIKAKLPPMTIYLTAMTHAAILACLKKLDALQNCYQSIKGYPLDWMKQIDVQHVQIGAKHPLPAVDSSKSLIYAGTVHQLFTFSKRCSASVDCIVIDEAGQCSLGLAALVFRSIGNNGRVIIAGDTEQLAPILAAQYPLLNIPLFGSILDSVMSVSNFCRSHFNSSTGQRTAREEADLPLDKHALVVQLVENFRLNKDLGEFIATIYSRPFESQNKPSQQIALQLESLQTIDPKVNGSNLNDDVRNLLSSIGRAMLGRPISRLSEPRRGRRDNDNVLFSPISLVLIRLTEASTSTLQKQSSYEIHVHEEAVLAATIVHHLLRICPSESIFVATPHRIQRSAVKAALLTDNVRFEPSHVDLDKLSQKVNTMNLTEERSASSVTVDTIERLQGSEASFVICLFSHTQKPSVTDLTFLLQRRRLNVAISRAKTLCIFISSDSVLRPQFSVLADAEARKGYEFLRAYEERAWTGEINMNQEVDNA